MFPFCLILTWIFGIFMPEFQSLINPLRFIRFNKSNNKVSNNKWIILFTLILAGEMIFSLPFHVVRFFRPSFLEVFQITNTELGDAFAIYGILAMLAYFPGGPLADRFSARRLIALSLLLTGLGGFYFATIPNISGLRILFGYWGVTNIFLFWAGLIKATRDWGGHLKQGKAFGILDGGRGLLAAGVASLAVILFSNSLTGDPMEIDPVERTHALQTLIYLYTGLTIGAAILAWFIIPENSERNKPDIQRLSKGVKNALKNKNIWLQAMIVICAYCGYKGLDYYSLYAHQVLGMDEVESARFVSNASYLRFVGAIGAGLIVDRLSASRVIKVSFLITILTYLFLSILQPGSLTHNFIVGNILVSFLAVYALRGVYFALLEETKISGAITGTAVGVISVVGYTPDIFIHPLMGRILDSAPGTTGFQNFFLLLGFISLLGMACAMLVARRR